MRASSAEKAAHLLDTALSARSANSQGRDSHFVFTLHLFQHRFVHSSFQSHASRFILQFKDFTKPTSLQPQLVHSCHSLPPWWPQPSPPDRLWELRENEDPGRKHHPGWNTHPVLRELTSAQAGLGNVILGVLNGQRHLPFKESRVTQLLREVLGSVSCQVCDKISIAS